MIAVAQPDPAGSGATAGHRHASGFALGPAVVDVDTDTADAFRWLVEFLTPWVAATTFGHGDVLVRFTCSHAAFDLLDRRSATATATIPCFALDSHLVTLPGWDDGEGVVLADRQLRCFYRVGVRHVEVVARPGDRQARLGLMRVVREMLTSRRLARGRVVDLHAAAFEAGPGAVLIVGPKQSGKTTLLCYALASAEARLIANDRVVVDLDRAPGIVQGIPTLVSVRPHTVDFFPALRRGATGRPVLLHSGECEVEQNGKADGRGLSLSPAQLAQRLGSSCARGAPLAAIVFPEISAATERLDH